ncbi:MAG: outer spore coat protein CotE [Bacilli bacterium]|nr:outer spore coat protein CotE [Bacilli bacterium]
MTNYKEIVTKAVIGKGKKNFTSSNTIKPENNPTTILGCWVINHTFKGQKENDKIRINGSYDINVWYSYDNNTKTDVVRKSDMYEEVVLLKDKGINDIENEEIIVRSLKQPTVISAEVIDGDISYTIEKELGIELVGNTKVKIAVDEEEEEWEILDEDGDGIPDDIEQAIDNEVEENFLN